MRAYLNLPGFALHARVVGHLMFFTGSTRLSLTSVADRCPRTTMLTYRGIQRHTVLEHYREDTVGATTSLRGRFYMDAAPSLDSNLERCH